MATQFVEGSPRLREEPERKTVVAAGAGSMVEALAAAAAIVLAIIGLAGTYSSLMMCVGTIVLGAAFLFAGATVAMRYRRLVQASQLGEGGRTVEAETVGGMSAESLAGVAGVVLGILALLNLLPVLLCAIALIVFGGGLLIGSAATARFRSVGYAVSGFGETTRRVLDETVNASAGGQVLVGVGAIVLGILALIGIQPMWLVLVGLLAVGGSMLFSGTAIGARMLGMARHA